jgi:hypothetical protein
MLPLKRIATLPNGVERAIGAFSRISDGGHRLSLSRFFVASGGLIYYEPDLVSQCRRRAGSAEFAFSHDISALTRFFRTEI